MAPESRAAAAPPSAPAQHTGSLLPPGFVFLGNFIICVVFQSQRGGPQVWPAAPGGNPLLGERGTGRHIVLSGDSRSPPGCPQPALSPAPQIPRSPVPGAEVLPTDHSRWTQHHGALTPVPSPGAPGEDAAPVFPQASLVGAGSHRPPWRGRTNSPFARSEPWAGGPGSEGGGGERGGPAESGAPPCEAPWGPSGLCAEKPFTGLPGMLLVSRGARGRAP